MTTKHFQQNHTSHHAHKNKLVKHHPELFIKPKKIVKQLLLIDNRDNNVAIIKGEKLILTLLSIPIIAIAFISLLNIFINHAPYFNGICRHMNCVAGSGEQFVIWSILFILFVYYVARFAFK